MTKEEIIAIVRECTASLGHAPARAEFLALGKVTKHQVLKHFGNHTRMLAASGVAREGSGYPISMRSLFLDWARVVRELGKVPTLVMYDRLSKYSMRPLQDRFRCWRDVPEGMLECARQEGLEGEWQDVLDIIALHRPETPSPARRSATASAISSTSATCRSRSLDGLPRGPRQARLLFAGVEPRGSRQARLLLAGVKPAYGRPLPHAPLSYAPTNEAGVAVLFGSMARELGFVILRVQTGFPDCEAMREVDENHWQRVRIEFEYESRNFFEHMHAAEDCDLIVCWNHNWPDCPVEVLELQSVAGAGDL